MIKAQVWDTRRCWVGEGPASSGPGNNSITWVDILNGKILAKDLATEKTSEHLLNEDVGFAIPRTKGGHVIGINSGPSLRDADGRLHPLPNRLSADGKPDPVPTRWNDAKISPTGDLWLGTLAYDNESGLSALYKMDRHGKSLTRIIEGVTCSNGIDWSDDGKTMYYVDTMTGNIDAFDYDGSDISNRRTMVSIPEADGYPDGICMDAQGGLWVAFWGSGEVRRFDEKFKVSEIITMPSKFVTSCVFAGPNLDQLIITSAHNGDPDGDNQAGMTCIATPGVRGRTTTLYPL